MTEGIHTAILDLAVPLEGFDADMIVGQLREFVERGHDTVDPNSIVHKGGRQFEVSGTSIPELKAFIGAARLSLLQRPA